jgi:hypothetical protein
VKRDRDGFVWGRFRLGECRLAAMRLFLADFEGRYVASSLPTLPFAGGQFRLAVVSHFLFLYSGLFGLDFHVAACEELLRVAEELRVFPLLGLDRRWSPHVAPVCEHLGRAGLEAEVVATKYEFQKADDHAGNRLLRVRRKVGRRPG